MGSSASAPSDDAYTDDGTCIPRAHARARRGAGGVGAVYRSSVARACQRESAVGRMVIIATTW
ncbi:uncharacterized protein TRAVEDRAFT_29569 [Trametes versicolor FP-101664 SS1]|uniref:uncharacterized protein n=1 Tax=Trametes versicolor (strain FP-101664) TaxID=717944 RepID=UPI0004622117|nr:uncharacterized protein TRAVEDRAFT_29569 [Trametes versicolor FP-101664 SS1]EIW57490.1 hypothetical protein TRAVEDRAFT_29569 [Trametes versicolor FP-101664 SS1]